MRDRLLGRRLFADQLEPATHVLNTAADLANHPNVGIRLDSEIAGDAAGQTNGNAFRHGQIADNAAEVVGVLLEDRVLAKFAELPVVRFEGTASPVGADGPQADDYGEAEKLPLKPQATAREEVKGHQNHGNQAELHHVGLDLGHVLGRYGTGEGAAGRPLIPIATLSLIPILTLILTLALVLTSILCLRLRGRQIHRGIEINAVYGNGLTNILDALFANRLKPHAQLVMNLLENGRRNANTTGGSNFLQPRRNIDPFAIEIVVLLHDVSDIDADPVLHRTRVGRVAGGKFFLNLHGALHRFDNTGQVGQETIAGRDDDRYGLPTCRGGRGGGPRSPLHPRPSSCCSP